MGEKDSARPHPALRSLERLVGAWEVAGPQISGQVVFEWLDGGFFLVQRVDMEFAGRTIRGVEYIGYDEASHLCKSHFFDNVGHLFTYVWELDGDELTIWFGRKGSDNRFAGRFSDDGDSYGGAWKWPGGGYEATMSRSKR